MGLETVMNKVKTSFAGAIAFFLICTISLAGCTSEEKPYQSKLSPISHYVQEILDELEVIVQASNLRQETDGVTETFLVNSQGTTFEGHGDVTWTTAYDPETKTHTSRYPGNPTYREAGTGPQAVGIAKDVVANFKAGDPEPTEIDGVFTFEASAEVDQVIIIYTKDGLVTGALIQDSLVDPSFTNFYEVNFYNITNPIADQILKTKE
jgi:hypothetical protein